MSPAIRQLTGKDAADISALAIRSKAVWSYSEEQMAVFRNELTMTPEQIDKRIAYGVFHPELLGFYTLVVQTPERSELEHLFVDPDHLATDTELSCSVMQWSNANWRVLKK